MRCKLVQCLFFCLLLQNSFAQTKEIDSLKSVYVNSTVDTTRLAILDRLRNLLTVQDEKIEYLNKQLVLADKLHKYEMAADIISKLGWYKYVNEQFAEAESLYHKSITICQKYKYTRIEGLNYTRLMMLFWWLGKTKEGMAYFEKAETALLRVNANVELSNLYLNTSEVYKNIKLFDQALFYAKKSFYYANKSQDSAYIIQSTAFLGDAYRAAGKSKEALNTLRTVLILAESRGDIYSQGDINYFLCSYYYDKKDYSSASKYCKKALDLYTQQHAEDRIISVLAELADIYFLNKDFAHAKETLLKQKELIGIGNTMEERYVYKGLANIDLINKDINSWQRNTTLADSLEDLFTSSAVKKAVLEINTKYQTSLKEKKIILLQEQKNIQKVLIIGLLLSLMILTVFGLFFYRYINQKKIITEQENIQLKQEKQLMTMDNILKVQEEERSRVAKDLHDGLGGMLSGIKLNLSAMKGNVILQQQDAGLFAKSIEQLDNAISEMRRVAHNMMPESLLKFGLSQAVQDYCESLNESKVIQVTFKNLGLNERLENSVEIVLYRIIQELVNNVIKHANAKHVFIQLSKNEHLLTLTVEDDGKGFDVKSIENIRGFGLTNIQSRVDYLKGSLNIDSNIETGTSVFVEIPL